MEFRAKADHALRAYHARLQVERAEPVWVERSFNFNLGRHSLRAAFQVLVGEGIVVHRRHRGAFVAIPTGAEMADLLAYRSALELGALQVAFTRGARFDEAAEALDRLAGMDDDTGWASVARVHHDLLADAYRSLQRELEFFVTRIRPAYTVRTMVEVHARLVEALRGGDPAAATAALERDLAAGRSALTPP